MNIKTQKTMFFVILGFILFLLTIGVGLSIWIITDSVSTKPSLEVNGVLIKYLDDKEGTYDGNILLPSSETLNLDGNEITYFYKTNVDEEYVEINQDTKTGPINAGNYLIKVIYYEEVTVDSKTTTVEKVVEDLTFVIKPKPASELTAEFTNEFGPIFYYTGLEITEIEDTFVINYTINEREVVLVKDVDYTVTFSEKTTVSLENSPHIAEVTFLNSNFSGSLSVPYEIKKSILKINIDETIYYGGYCNLVYSGSELALSSYITVTNSQGSIVDTAVLSYEWSVFPDVTYENTESLPINKGNYNFRITATEPNYETAVIEEIVIVAAKNISNATVNITVGDYVYNGGEHQPSLDSVILDGVTLIEHTDWDGLTFSNNVNAGSNTAKVIVNGIGNYTGQAEAKFSIAKAIPTVTTWPTIGVIQEGEQGTITGGSSNIAGTFDYTLAAGTKNLKFTVGTVTTQSSVVGVTFIPTDLQNYEKVNNTISVIIEAVCYIGNTYYGTIDSALAVATNSQIVYVIPGKNPTIRNNCEIKSGVTLCLPYSDTTWNGRQTGENNWFDDGGGTMADANESRVTTYCKNKVLINDNIILTNNGTLQIGGVLGQEAPILSGHTSGNYTQITMGSNAQIISNGTITCLGYIKEQTKDNGSLVDIQTGTTYIPFVVHDYKGGSQTAALYTGGGSLLTASSADGNISPFSIYSTPNIQSKMLIKYNASLIGYADLFTSAIDIKITTINAQHNTTNINLIGSSNSVINLSGGYAEIKYDAVDCRYTSITQDRINLKLYGGASTGAMSLSIKLTFSINISTENVLFPISWIYDIELYDGDFNFQNKIKFMPGSTLLVGEGAVTNIDADLIFYGEGKFVDQNSVYKYPSNKAGAYVTVNGELNINAPFGGMIYTANDSAILNINNNTAVSSIEGDGSRDGTDLVFTLQSTITEVITGSYISDIDNPVIIENYTEFVKMPHFSNGEAWYQATGYKQYTIIVNANGGYFGTESTTSKTYKYSIKETDTEVITHMNATTPTREHYRFVGWYKDAACTEHISTGLTVSPEGTYNLYAKWELKEYKVDYIVVDQDGNIVEAFENPGTDTFTIEDDVIIATPSLDGYTFYGWFTDFDRTVLIQNRTMTAEEFKSLTTNDILYGYFTNLKEYTVTFNTNDTTITFTSERYVEGTLLDLSDKNALLTTNDINSSISKYFGGWYTTSTFDLGTEFNNGDPVNNDVTLYAKWENKSYTVVYQATYYTWTSFDVAPTSSTHTIGTEYYISGQVVAIQQSCSPEGYTFNGWILNSSAITEIDTSLLEENETTIITANLTANTYQINVNCSYYTSSITTGTFTFGSNKVTINIQQSTSAGILKRYTFTIKIANPSEMLSWSKSDTSSGWSSTASATYTIYLPPTDINISDSRTT